MLCTGIVVLGFRNFLRSTRDKEVDRRGRFFLVELERDRREFSLFRDHIDYFSLDNHVPQGIHLAASLDSSPNSARRIILLGRQTRNFFVVVLRLILNVFNFGDFLQDKMLLEKPFRTFEYVFSQSVFAGNDLIFTKSAGPKLHHTSVQFTLGLASEQIRWQFPGRRFRQGFADLFAYFLALSIIQLVFK